MKNGILNVFIFVLKGKKEGENSGYKEQKQGNENLG